MLYCITVSICKTYLHIFSYIEKKVKICKSAHLLDCIKNTVLYKKIVFIDYFNVTFGINPITIFEHEVVIISTLLSRA